MSNTKIERDQALSVFNENKKRDPAKQGLFLFLTTKLIKYLCL